MKKLLVLGLALAGAIALAGCTGVQQPAAPKSVASSAPTQSTAVPASQASSGSNPHPVLGGGDKISSAPAPAPAPLPAPSPSPAPISSPSQGTPQSVNIKLVPLPARDNIEEKMLIPEGAKVTTTALGDGIQVSKDKVRINVHTWQLRDEKPPMTVDAALKLARAWAPDATVKQLKLPGTAVAYEILYSQTQAGTNVRGLMYHLYGSTYQATVTCEAPSADFAAWEPVFRQILASFQPGNLNAEALPGRP